jgi:LemA protein
VLWWVLVGAGVLVLVACTLLYNRLVKLCNRVDNAWSQVDVQLRRRYDLIPNLVATVKAYATHESETLGVVVRACDGARSAATSRSRARPRVP